MRVHIISILYKLYLTSSPSYYKMFGTFFLALSLDMAVNPIHVVISTHINTTHGKSADHKNVMLSPFLFSRRQLLHRPGQEHFT